MTDLDRTGVDDPLLPSETLGDRVLCDDGLSGGRVGRDEDRLLPLDRGNGDLLERIKLEGVHSSRGNGGDVLTDGHVRVGRRDGDLVSNLRTAGGSSRGRRERDEASVRRPEIFP